LSSQNIKEEEENFIHYKNMIEKVLGKDSETSHSHWGDHVLGKEGGDPGRMTDGIDRNEEQEDKEESKDDFNILD